MKIFPAVDLFEGKAVRLLKGSYSEMTVYSERPFEIAEDFRSCGAEYIHIVDLEGARSGSGRNFELIRRIAKESGLYTQVGGGIRSMETVDRYLSSGIDRVILGTAAVTDADFLRQALYSYGEKIAVSVDLKDGFLAIRGWEEKSSISLEAFCETAASLSVKTLICTDISKDGTLLGPNFSLLSRLSDSFDIDIIASGGLSCIADIEKLKSLGLYGAIIGRAYYEGAINLKEALEAAK